MKTQPRTAGPDGIDCVICGKRFQNPKALDHHIYQKHPANGAASTIGLNVPVPGTRRVRVYCRVSTDDQSNAIQLQKIRAHVNLKGWEIAGIYEDQESGSRMNRPALQALLGDLQAGEVWLITHPDRLSRSTLDFCFLTEQVKAKGAEIYAIDCPIDTTSPFGEAFWKMMGVFAELERNLIKARTQAAWRTAKANGKICHRHPTACGIDYPCPAGIDHLARARERAAKRQKEGARKVGPRIARFAPSESRAAEGGA